MSERTDASSPPSIELDGVSVELGGQPVLRDVSVRLDQSRIAVIGANGSGKSTFARLLNGLLAPTTGRVTVHGIDVQRDPRRIRERVGFVFTNPDAQILMPTVAEDVALSLRGSGLHKSEIAARVAAALERHGLGERADQPAYSLSGGQKQLLALISVLIREPAVVVADEPTTLLDLGNARRIGRLLLEDVVAQTVIVTHDLELAARCDVALRFADGRLVETGEPAQVIARYRAEHGDPAREGLAP
ncbi:energy-coupling factor ABC transporter ATP-binding protein [Microbacterium stercoris]|uniref:ABC transporter ATP-binding protein n=1 Tax=Microbacterium stercoris TaxID=2820289 RepID=A0A939TPU3_9MICO|nr:ABC transporter ATP-binding protein [Microbacterium stercoris]MBO3662446.1 ABC transporter ATP-binding protein [Microbacterium stercoris]MBO3664438.1 ABC transporter ATP-binding protein [Microbacterium stercoris]